MTSLTAKNSVASGLPKPRFSQRSNVLAALQWYADTALNKVHMLLPRVTATFRISVYVSQLQAR